MGKLFDQGARGERDKVKLEDLARWAEDIESEYRCIVHLGLQLASLNKSEGWSLWAKAVEASLEPHPVVLAEVRQRWPDTNHKTVLGSFLYLLIKLEQEMEASAALDAL